MLQRGGQRESENLIIHDNGGKVVCAYGIDWIHVVICAQTFLFDMYVCTIWLEDVIGKWILIEWSLLGHKGPLEVSDNFGQGSSKSEEQCWLNYVIPTPNSS